MPSNYEKICADNLHAYGHEDHHLAFLGKLYADRTHFIFELLQNAEDAGAHAIRFDLYPDRLEVKHDGRPFNEADVVAVCSVGRGTKGDNLTKIGKFGIGFKSVYAFTAAPIIYSGDERFRIVSYVRPYEVEPVDLRGCFKTKFVFPFDQPDVPAKQAFREIAAGLEKLDPSTLLFLHNLRSLAWGGVDRDMGGGYLRELVTQNGPCRGVKVTRLESRGVVGEEHWLLCARPVAVPGGTQTVDVEIAFRLTMRDGKPDQVRPVHPSHLVVFFPTDKETHLGFLVQGPYVTTPARDNIPTENEWNTRLVEETGALLIDFLRYLHYMKLLSVEVLDALPIEVAEFEGTMFWPLYEQVHDALETEEFYPTSDGQYVSAPNVRLGRSADLINLFSPQQLGSLLRSNTPIHWLSPAISEIRTGNLYRYLTGTQFGDARPLVRVLRPEDVVRELSREFCVEQTDQWLTQLYGVLATVREATTVARSKEIIRLEDDEMVAAYTDGRPQAFLPSAGDTDLPIIKRCIAADENARRFFTALGLSEPDAVADILEKILPLYGEGAWVKPGDHDRHLERVIACLRTPNSRRAELISALGQTAFFQAQNAVTKELAFKKPTMIYLPTPDLLTYHEGNVGAWFFHEPANLSGDDRVALGIGDKVDVMYETPDKLGYIPKSGRHRQHKRGVDRFDPDFDIDGLDIALGTITANKALLIWNTLAVPYAHTLKGVVEECTRQTFEGATRTEMMSTAGKALKENVWLPDREGHFHRPPELSLEDLPEGFQPNELAGRALGMQMPEVARLAETMGIAIDDLQYFLAYQDEFRDFQKREERRAARAPKTTSFPAGLTEALNRPGAETVDDDFVEPGPLTDPARREAAVAHEIEVSRQQARRGPSFRRAKTWVCEGKDSTVRAYLLAQYGGRCQICQEEPFAKRDGTPYFEAVYFVSYKTHQWVDRPGNVLCLCADCSARIEHGAVEAADAEDQIRAFRPMRAGGDGKPKLRIRLVGKDKSIRFTEKHMLDLQLMVLAEEDTRQEQTA